MESLISLFWTCGGVKPMSFKTRVDLLFSAHGGSFKYLFWNEVESSTSGNTNIFRAAICSFLTLDIIIYWI